MLHIVNGDHVGDKLRQANIQGDILVWREIYPVGPVFEDMSGQKEKSLRARYLEETLGIPAADFISSCESQEQALQRFDTYKEVVLWFEHDLFDQTMLCCLLHWFAKQDLGTTRIHLLCIGDYPGVDQFRGLGQLTSEQLKSLFGTWRPIEEEQLELGSHLWKAYASQRVEDHIGILQTDTSELPFARAAFTQHAARLPSPTNGLGIVEQTILEIVEKGIHSSSAIFKDFSEQQHEIGMGDVEFWYRLRTLSTGPNALLARRAPDASFEAAPQTLLSLEPSAVELTEQGRKVLSGAQDWIIENGIDEWYGGLHLTKDTRWRWDRTEKRLVYI